MRSPRPSRAVLAALAASVVSSCALPASANAAPCLPGDRGLSLAVDKYAPGGRARATLRVARSSIEVSNVIIGTQGARPRLVDVAPEEPTTVILPTGNKSGQIVVSVSWHQVEDFGIDTVQCDGVARATATGVRSGTRVGDASLPRLEGRWRVRFTPDNYTGGHAETLIWRITPLCDVGACSVRVRSSGGRRRRFTLRLTEGAYEMRDDSGIRLPGYDCVTAINGREVSRIRRALRFYFRLRLLVTTARTKDGNPLATQSIGKLYAEGRPIGAAECEGSTWVDRLTARRLR